MDPLKDKALKAAIQRVSRLSMELHDLMESGMTIDVVFPNDEKIIVPGKLPKIRRLVVTKPAIHLQLSPEPAESIK